MRRLEFRSQWQAYFDQVDVFLSPVAFTAAFAHDHSEPQDQRTILTSSSVKPYFDVLNWSAPATLTEVAQLRLRPSVKQKPGCR